MKKISRTDSVRLPFERKIRSIEFVKKVFTEVMPVNEDSIHTRRMRDWALYTVCELGEAEVASYLLSIGGHYRNSSGSKNSFTAAIKGGHLNIVKILISHGISASCDDDLPIIVAADCGNLAKVA